MKNLSTRAFALALCLTAGVPVPAQAHEARTDGVPRRAALPLPVEHRAPRVRVEPLPREPLPTVGPSTLAAFLDRPLVVDAAQLAASPRIVAGQDGRTYLSRGDLAYARGIADHSVRDWHVYRQAQPLPDPETHEPLAWEALFVGSARLERLGDPSTLRITAASEEIGAGDRLLPADPPRIADLVVRPPGRAVTTRIIAVHRGLTQVGPGSVVAVDAGDADGLEAGNVLAIRRAGDTVRDARTNERLRLPDETVGRLLLFRVFDTISYGLVTDASRAVAVGDAVTNPR